MLKRTWYLFTFISTVITFLFLYWPQFANYLKNASLLFQISFFIIILIITMLISVILIFLNKRVVLTINNIKIEITSGVLFANEKCQLDGYNIISISELFSSRFGRHVSKNTTHYKFLSEIVGNNVDEFEKKVADALSDVDSFVRLDGIKRYPLGTTASVPFGGVKYIFVSTVAKDDAFRCISTNLDDYVKILSRLWKTVREENEGYPFNTPLIGSGRAGVNLSPHQLLQLMILSIFYESQKDPITDIIRIVIDKEKMKYIDLNSIRIEWDSYFKKNFIIE